MFFNEVHDQLEVAEEEARLQDVASHARLARPLMNEFRVSIRLIWVHCEELRLVLDCDWRCGRIAGLLRKDFLNVKVV